MSWSKVEEHAALALIDLALQEDLEEAGDLTSLAVLPEGEQGSAFLVARAAGVLAGLPIVELVYRRLHTRVAVQCFSKDGQTIEPGQRLVRVSGPLHTLLAAERTILNFLQRLSGVATQTSRYAAKLEGLACQLLDTRKTTPGWRRLEKYAVRCGGGHNHRMGLFDGIMIKDNHLAALGKGPGVIQQAIEAARAAHQKNLPLEVEVETLVQLEEALRADPDVILLDNMDVGMLRAAVQRRDDLQPQVKLEASGGITLSNLRDVAETGVDYVSIGALTHSAPALDLAMDYET